MRVECVRIIMRKLMKLSTVALSSALTVILTLSSAAAQTGALQIREGYVRELPPGQSTSAAYMDVVNSGSRPVAIVAAVSDAAQSAEVHRHRHLDGAMRMEHVQRLVIPAHDHVLFAPGGYHLMLINLKRTLRAGDNVTVTLLDEEGKSYTARIPVVKMIGAEK